ncbi:hypothetical protein Sjap_000268 [Stephania japonica]|uniref:Transmembrane protein n=1 Tax=Stephania japonica TaxID=461633 RepID=A0AAP0KHP0_9MAGN
MVCEGVAEENDGWILKKRDLGEDETLQQLWWLCLSVSWIILWAISLLYFIIFL